MVIFYSSQSGPKGAAPLGCIRYWTVGEYFSALAPFPGSPLYVQDNLSRTYGPNPMQTIRHVAGTGGSSGASMTK